MRGHFCMDGYTIEGNRKPCVMQDRALWGELGGQHLVLIAALKEA